MSEPIYETIGSGYNATRHADPYITERLLELLQPETGKQYIDIGCGTGNYTTALFDRGLNICGVDPSEKMLRVARSQNNHIQWITGSAEQIPLADQTFHGAIATLTLHHWANIEASLHEIGKKLQPQGRIVFFTATPQQMKGYWLNHYFPQMLQSSMIQMPALETLELASRHSGFEITTIEKYFVKDNLIDQFLYVGKNRPEVYFRDATRRGISSFSALANSREVLNGLDALKADMQSGRFISIQKQYENDLGDYLFVVAEKKPQQQ